MIFPRHPLLALALVCFPCGAVALEPRPCADSLQALGYLTGDASFPLRWEETTMTDGRPLTVAILQKDGALFLEFVKTGEGLWAEGPAVICKDGRRLEARIARISMGPAAPWILRGSLGQGRTFALSRQSTGHLEISTLGWKGAFVPKQSP